MKNFVSLILSSLLLLLPISEIHAGTTASQTTTTPTTTTPSYKPSSSTQVPLPNTVPYNMQGYTQTASLADAKIFSQTDAQNFVSNVANSCSKNPSAKVCYVQATVNYIGQTAPNNAVGCPSSYQSLMSFGTAAALASNNQQLNYYNYDYQKITSTGDYQFYVNQNYYSSSSCSGALNANWTLTTNTTRQNPSTDGNLCKSYGLLCNISQGWCSGGGPSEWWDDTTLSGTSVNVIPYGQAFPVYAIDNATGQVGPITYTANPSGAGSTAGWINSAKCRKQMWSDAGNNPYGAAGCPVGLHTTWQCSYTMSNYCVSRGTGYFPAPTSQAYSFATQNNMYTPSIVICGKLNITWARP